MLSYVIAALAGAAGAALGHLAAKLLAPNEELEGRPKWPVLVGFIVAMAISIPVTQWASRPSADQMMAEVERKIPAYAAIRKNEPEAYAQLQTILRSGMASGKSPDELANEVRVVVGGIYGRKVPAARDDLVIAAATLVADQTRHLQSDPQTCVNLIFGRAGSLTQKLPPEMQKREFALLEEVVSAPSLEQPKVATQDELVEAMGPLLRQMASESGSSEQRVTEALSGKGEPAFVCKTFSRLMQGLTSGPAEESAAALRGLYKAGQTG